MYPTMKKAELKELNKLGKKFGYHIGWVTWNKFKTQNAINDANARWINVVLDEQYTKYVMCFDYFPMLRKLQGFVQ